MKLFFNLGALLASTLLSTNTSLAQTGPPIRELLPPTATSVDRFATILGVRPLTDGRLLVNDGRSRQLIVLDQNLANRVVLFDSVAAPAGGSSYGTRASPFIPYLRDTTLFADWSSLALNVISPSGIVVRTISAPKPSDVRSMGTGQSGSDSKGNLVYQGFEKPSQIRGAIDSDSEPIVRANFETRTVDTIGRVARHGGDRTIDETVNGVSTPVRLLNPVRFIDEWAVLSDGSIVLLRGHDYHADILQPDGKRISGPKLAFDWKRLTELDKQALIDSARKQREAIDKDPNASPMMVSGSALMAASQSGVRPTNANQPKFLVREVPINEIADFWPPIRMGAARADLDDNLWVLPTTSAQSKNGELVYDVINNKGEMIERVRIPDGRALAGFGHNGVVYLMHRETIGGWILERTAVARGAH